MTLDDDQQEIDELLRRAGAEWRRQQPPPPEPDLARGRQLNQPQRRWLFPALAAASIAIVLLVVSPVLKEPDPAPPTGSGPHPSSSEQAPQGSARALIVHEGDRVEVTGLVIAAPNQDALYCPPRPTAQDPQDPLATPGETPPAAVRPIPTCPASLAVRLNGLDVDRLASAETIQATRIGYATIRGTWQGQSIDITEQTAPEQPSPAPLDDVPCTAPSGGWRVEKTDSPSELNALDAHLKAQPQRFSNGRVTYQNSPAGQATVMVVPVVSGDLSVTEQELSTIYHGNLCITRGTLSIAEGDSIAQRVGSLMNTARISGVSVQGDQVHVTLFILTDQLYEQLASIGVDKLDLQPAVRPVG
jgi:hypothetical protein